MKLHTMFKNSFIVDLFALLSGMLLTLAFAPYDIFLFAIISPAILLATWLTVSPSRAFVRGFLFGLGLFGTGVHWIFTSINTYGEASLLLSCVLTISFIFILSVFPAYVGYLLNRYFPMVNNAKVLLAFPTLWVLIEWMRSWLFTGFPWLLIGYSQVNSPLKGYAPLFSVYGVSLAVVLSSSLLVCLIIKYKQGQRRHMRPYALSLLALWVIASVLCFIPWTSPQGEPVQVSLVQGDIPQELKWTPDEIQPTLNRYVGLTQAHWDSNIIIWPEAAIPVTLQDASAFIEKLSEAATQHHVTLITGIPVKVPNAETYYNAVVTVGDGSGVYLKRRLVPFGEFVPMGAWMHKFLGSLNIPMSDFIEGPRRPMALKAGDISIATYICFEIAFPELAHNNNPNMGMILTVSNDAWFGHSIAQAQHLQTAMMRAIEMRRPVLFVSNNGITAIITPYGKIQAVAPPFQAYVLTDKVQARKGLTPWQRFALDPLLLILGGMLFLAFRRRSG